MKKINQIIKIVFNKIHRNRIIVIKLILIIQIMTNIPKSIRRLVLKAKIAN